MRKVTITDPINLTRHEGVMTEDKGRIILTNAIGRDVMLVRFVADDDSIWYGIKSDALAERPQTMTLTDAAKAMGVTRQRAYQLYKSGQIIGDMVNGRIVLSKASVTKIMEG